MILNKALLLKCLGGVAACTGVAGVGIWGSQQSGRNNNDSSESESKLNKLLEKVGLSGSTTTENSNECTIGSLKVKQESNSEENKIKGSSSETSGKIKVYSVGQTEGYENNFKFVIEEGDISFGSSTGTQITKLEQFETYEIKEETEGATKKWYLTRKTKAAEGIRKALGLPDSCTLPENTNTSDGNSCQSISADDLKAINFDGKQNEGATISNVTASLTITKLTSTDSDFPFGYKFSIQPTQKLTISTGNPENSIPANVGVEFKIKKTSGTNQISLEKAWTLQSLAEKVGLESCNDSSKECSIKDGSLNIKQDETKEENKTKDSSSQGKIKFHKDTSGYKEGFKFVIEDGDISFNSSGSQISKLEQFETYEIEESGGKYYLSRKTKAFKEISKALGLPDGCDELTNGNTTDCSNLNEAKLKGINFDGKSSDGVNVDNSATIKLKVTKLTSSDAAFPLGYKFVLESDKEITIPKNSPTLTIKKNTNTEFKIKVTTTEGSKTLSLEKAWTAKSLGEKVGLVCKEPSNTDKSCTLKDGSINVNNGGDSKIDGAKEKSGQGSSKKVTYQEDAEGHNQGIKFTVDGSDCIELTKDGNGDTAPKIENSTTTYEIKEHTENSGTKWYLTKYTAPASK